MSTGSREKPRRAQTGVRDGRVFDDWRLTDVPFAFQEFAGPDRLEIDGGVLLPLRVEHAKLDYEALMASREHLRVWESGDWPGDDFTLQENRADLERHQREHEAGEAFTYTVLDRPGSRCLGCVYILALDDALKGMGLDEEAREDVCPDDAFVTLWVRASEVDGSLERHLVAELRTWFDAAWPFGRVAFCSHTSDPRQCELFQELGLVVRREVPMGGTDARYVLFESPEGGLPHGKGEKPAGI